MNHDYDYSEISHEQQPFELTPYHVIAILIGLSLLCWGAYRFFKSSDAANSILSSPATSLKLSASDIASLLAT